MSKKSKYVGSVLSTPSNSRFIARIRNLGDVPSKNNLYWGKSVYDIYLKHLLGIFILPTLNYIFIFDKAMIILKTNTSVE